MQTWLIEQRVNTHQDTGYHSWVLVQLWDKYEDALHLEKISCEDFYLVLVYIHLYPTHRQCPRVLRKTRGYLTARLFPTLHKLARIIREVSWEARLSPFNHVSELPPSFTGK